MRQLRDESGFTLVEVLFVCVICVILMGAIAMIFGAGLTTSNTTSNVIASQTGVIVGLDRLDYEGRCASSAALVSSGAGVTFTFPSQCTHATGTVTWCVTGGSLVRYTGSACSGSGQTLTTGVSSATPFSCVTSVGTYPAVKAILSVNAGTASSTAATGTDVITLQNAALTTASVAGCS